MDQIDGSAEFFCKYADEIAADLQRPAPDTAEDRAEILLACTEMEHLQNKGPLAKLMRWFSWFECARLYRPQLFAIKMILHYMLSGGQPMSDDAELAPAAESAELAPAAESAPSAQESDAQAAQPVRSAQDEAEAIRDLKKSKGSLRVAYDCITAQNRWNTDLLLLLGQPLWSRHAKDVARNCTSEQVMDHHVAMARGSWQDELLQIVQSVLCSEALGALGLCALAEDVQGMQDKAATVFDALVHFLHYRARPPRQHADSDTVALALAMLAWRPSDIIMHGSATSYAFLVPGLVILFVQPRSRVATLHPGRAAPGPTAPSAPLHSFSVLMQMRRRCTQMSCRKIGSAS